MSCLQAKTLFTYTPEAMYGSDLIRSIETQLGFTLTQEIFPDLLIRLNMSASGSVLIVITIGLQERHAKIPIAHRNISNILDAKDFDHKQGMKERGEKRMKYFFGLISMFVLMFSACVADSIDTFDINDPDNFEERIHIARDSVNAAIMLLPQIQERIHTNPDEACDLVGTCWKYLNNAQNLLDIEDEDDMDQNQYAGMLEMVQRQMWRWISVKEALPKTDTDILFIHNGKVRFGQYIWYDPDYRWLDLEFHEYCPDVKHWMPLPPLPKDE